MAMRISVILIGLLLTGCAGYTADRQRAKMEPLLEPYKGRTIADYIVAKGPPVRVTPLSPTTQLFEWTWSEQTPGAAMIMNGMVVSKPAGVATCTVAFVARAQAPNPSYSQWIIENWRYDGAC